MMQRIFSFTPVCDAESRVLILGSMASVKSLEAGFYYMHPQNRFWRILSRLTDDDFVGADTEGKKALLLKNKLALADILLSCERAGSLDGDIKNAEVRDLAPIFEKGKIEKIFCNGRKSYDTTIKNYVGKSLNGKEITADDIVYLPSSSPANAAKFDEKQWETIKNHIK